MPSMRVEPAAATDLATVRAVYAHGRQMQRAQGSPVWPEFEDDAILREIDDGHLMRVLDGDTVAGVFTVLYADPAIWGDRERGAHLYLHRIARAATSSTPGLITAILRWAFDRCRALGREGLRMDTWASNDALIAYYQRLGFRRVGRRCIPHDARLPPHYHGVELALLEAPSVGDASRPPIRHDDDQAG